MKRGRRNFKKKRAREETRCREKRDGDALDAVGWTKVEERRRALSFTKVEEVKGPGGVVACCATEDADLVREW